MQKTVKRLTTPLALKADDAGSVSAVFSVFDVVDTDGDVVVKGAIAAGAAVPMVWAHDWTQPVGKGTVRVTGTEAIFEGRFFLDTQAGREAYETVKAMGDLQEWSWGFRVLDHEWGTKDGRRCRFIKSTELYEVSPVLVGANRLTGTLAVKAAYLYSEMAGSYEALADALLVAAEARLLGDARDGWCGVVATYPDHVFVWVWEDGYTYYRFDYTIGEDGRPALGEAQAVEPALVPVETMGATYAGQVGRVLADLTALTGRTKALAALRRADGRAVKGDRVAPLAATARALADELDAATAAPGEPAGQKARSRYLALATRMHERGLMAATGD